MCCTAPAKPSASVSQLACTRSGCHDIEKVRTTTKNDGVYKFRHDKHLGLEYSGLTLQCGSCHSHVKGDEHFEVNTGICITCHLLERDRDGGSGAGPEGARVVPVIRMAVREGSSGPASVLASPEPAEPGAAPAVKLPPSACSTCHTPPDHVIERRGLKIDHAQYLAFGAACESCHRGTTATPEPIEDGRCLECHNFGVERTLKTEEMHKIHSEGRHKIECFSCHGTVRHGPTAQTASLEQLDCRKCHTDQHAVQRKTYVFDNTSASAAAVAAAAHMPGNAPAVSPMFLAHVDCTGCHTSKRPVSVKPDSGATVAAATASACDRCHRQGLGEKMIPLWQKTTHELYDQLAADVAAAETELNGSGAELTGECRRLLELVRVDGSWGVHNPRYTQQLLEQARAKLATARAKAKEAKQ